MWPRVDNKNNVCNAWYKNDSLKLIDIGEAPIT